MFKVLAAGVTGVTKGLTWGFGSMLAGFLGFKAYRWIIKGRKMCCKHVYDALDKNHLPCIHDFLIDEILRPLQEFSTIQQNVYREVLRYVEEEKTPERLREIERLVMERRTVKVKDEDNEDEDGEEEVYVDRVDKETRLRSFYLRQWEIDKKAHIGFITRNTILRTINLTVINYLNQTWLGRTFPVLRPVLYKLVLPVLSTLFYARTFQAIQIYQNTLFAHCKTSETLAFLCHHVEFMMEKPWLMKAHFIIQAFNCSTEDEIERNNYFDLLQTCDNLILEYRLNEERVDEEVINILFTFLKDKTNEWFLTKWFYDTVEDCICYGARDAFANLKVKDRTKARLVDYIHRYLHSVYGVYGINGVNGSQSSNQPIAYTENRFDVVRFYNDQNKSKSSFLVAIENESEYMWLLYEHERCRTGVLSYLKSELPEIVHIFWHTVFPVYGKRTAVQTRLMNKFIHHLNTRKYKKKSDVSGYDRLFSSEEFYNLIRIYKFETHRFAVRMINRCPSVPLCEDVWKIVYQYL